MKKVIIAIGILLSGCTNAVQQDSPYKILPTEKMEMDNVVIVRIDSCEYLYAKWGNGTWVTHKGDCGNPLHKMK